MFDDRKVVASHPQDACYNPGYARKLHAGEVCAMVSVGVQASVACTWSRRYETSLAACIVLIEADISKASMACIPGTLAFVWKLVGYKKFIAGSCPADIRSL